MFDMEDKENETQQENEKAGKLLAEPSGQKPRRSVLKEFDPFAPDSPCPPKQNIKRPDGLIIDEEEIFEDAETSLTSYMCVKNNKNLGNSAEKYKTSNNVTNGARESWLIPDLKDNQQEVVNLNDTADISYIEAMENLSQVDEALVDKTSSEEDFEFNSKKQTKNPEILDHNLENNLLNITSTLDGTNGLNHGNIMADSLEQTFDSSSQVNSTIENVQSPMTIWVTKNVYEHTEETEPRDGIQLKEIKGNENGGLGSMIDSLELPDPQENKPVLDSTLEKHQEVLIDSLEVLRSEENTEETSSTIGVENVADKVQDDVLIEQPIVNVSTENENQCCTQHVLFNTSDINLKTPGLEATFEAPTNQNEISIIKDSTQFVNSTHEHIIVNNAKIDQTRELCINRADNLIAPQLSSTFEAPLQEAEVLVSPIDNDLNRDYDTAKENNANLNTTFETVSADTVISEAGLSLSDKIDADAENQKSLDVDTTLEASPMQEELPDLKSDIRIISSDIETSSVNLELNKTFEAPSSDRDQISTSDVNVELNTTFEAPSSDILESKTDQLQSDKIDTYNIVEQVQISSFNIKNSSVNLELNKTFEAPSSDHHQISTLGVNVELNTTYEATSSDIIESRTDQLQSDKIDTCNVNLEKVQIISSDIKNSSVNLELNKTFEAPSSDSGQISTSAVNVELNTTFEAPSSDIESKTDQLQSDKIDTCNVNVEHNRTVEAPSSEMVESKTDQHQNDKISTSVPIVDTDSALVQVSKQNEIPIAEKGATSVNNKDLDITVGPDENKLVIEKKLNETVEMVTQGERDLQQVESSVQKKADCNAESNPIYKTLSTHPHNVDPLIAENLDKDVISTVTQINETSPETTEKVLDNTIEQTVPANINTNETHVQDYSVSLKDIINIDPSIKDDISPDNIKQASSARSSLISSASEDVNSTFISEEQTAESSRVMEALAESLNQTIDVEESAIVDEINVSRSPNDSCDLSNEGLNVTLENVEKGSGYLKSVAENMDALKLEEKTEKRKSNKILERKETEEFEDLERQYNEKTQNTKIGDDEEVDTAEAIIEKFGDKKVDSGVQQEHSKVFLRQDTQEFEALERQFTANLQAPKEFSDALKLNEKTADNSAETIRAKENDTENSNTFKAAGKEPLGGEVLMEKTDLPEKPPVTGQVTIRVSGNICNANSICEEFEQAKTETAKEPFTGINLKSDLNNDKQESNSSNIQHQLVSNGGKNTTEVTMDNDANSKKTDTAPTEEVQNSTTISNVQVPSISENIARPKNRPEGRPNIRSIRNKTQVIDRAVSINDTSKRTKENDDIHTSLNSNECVKQVDEYKTASADLQKQVDRLQTELDTIKNENMRKDKYILTCALDLDGERDNVVKFKKQIEDYERTMQRQNEELRRLKEEEEKNARSLTSLEMAFANVFDKYEKAKSIIEAYRKNEEILQKNIHCAEDQLTKLEAKCSVMKEQYLERLKKVDDQVKQEKEKYRQDIAKLQAMVKRLEIKSSSLETALKQKTEECRALAALCDDITGKPM